MMKNLFRTDLPSISDSSDDSDSDIVNVNAVQKSEPNKIHFRCSSYIKPNNVQNNSLFVIDTEGIDIEQSMDNNNQSVIEAKNTVKPHLIDPEIEKVLEKSVITPGFDQKPQQEIVAKSMRQLKKERKVQREKTKGECWFDMPATELTEELQRDLEIIRMRDKIDPKIHYRKEDRSKLPKYFQVGHIVENKADFYSSRLTRKERKRTIVEEILHDHDLLAKNKRRYTEIKAREAITKRGSFQRKKGLSKRSKYNKHK